VTAARLLGIKSAAFPAWLSLGAALVRMADDGKRPLCQQRPDQWSPDAKPHERSSAAEACTYCPALHACAAFAQANGERHCVWGGLDLTHRKAKAA
jgi:hypothetical protein